MKFGDPKRHSIARDFVVGVIWLVASSCVHAKSVTVVDTGGIKGDFNSLAIGTDGYPVISYLDSTDQTANDRLKVLKCASATCTAGGNLISTIDAGSYIGYYTSIALGADGNPVISYNDGDKRTLKVAKCGNPSCSSVTSVTTVDPAGVGGFTSIAVPADGLPVISYSTFPSYALRVAKCANSSCSGSSTLTTIDFNSAGYTALAIGADGLPAISYYDMLNGRLKAAKCSTGSCAGPTTITVVDDSSASVGHYPSITVGIDGFPLISYYDGTNLMLKVAHCNDKSCVGSTRTVVDMVGANNPTGTSIGVGKDGLPSISYNHVASSTVRIAKCADIACVTPSTLTRVESGNGPSMKFASDGTVVLSFVKPVQSLAVAKCDSSSCGAILDVDGNGTVDALTDGLLILRYVFGLRGDALISGAVSSMATRKSSDSIEAYLTALLLQ